LQPFLSPTRPCGSVTIANCDPNTQTRGMSWAR
jgi:hypothetical protein